MQTPASGSAGVDAQNFNLTGNIVEMTTYVELL